MMDNYMNRTLGMGNCHDLAYVFIHKLMLLRSLQFGDVSPVHIRYGPHPWPNPRKARW
jgi:hypothetical protein